MDVIFEVVTATTDNAARALTTAARVRAMIGSPAGSDADITTLIDRATAMMVKRCRLARDREKPPTFGKEQVRATWMASPKPRRGPLVLPWRVPITSVTAVAADGIELEDGVDFRLAGGGLLLRLEGDREIEWCPGKIVVDYEVGWELPDEVPPELEAAAIEQVKYMWAARERDPSIRNEAVPDVYQAAFNVAGGDSIGESGLLISVEGVLADYRDWSVT